MTTALIEADSLYKVFPTSGDPVLALDDVSFEVRSGEFISMVGPSGCGKSTLLNILGGLLTRSRGSLRFAGTDHSEPARRSG